MIIADFFFNSYYYFTVGFFYFKFLFIKFIFLENFILGLNNDMFIFLLDEFYVVDFKNINNERKNFINDCMQEFVNFVLFFNYIYLILFIVFFFFLKNFFYKIILLFINIIFYGVIYNSLNRYFFFKTANYNFLYQIWYKLAKNQKNTYLSLRFRLVYLTKKFVIREFFNNNIFKDEVQEYFILKRKNFFDSHFKPTKIRRFVPLANLRKKFYTKQRRNYSFKGLLFFYLKDYEDRINKKEEQQKTLRIYEGIFGTYIYQELIKKNDQKQAKFVKMKLNREE